MQDTRDAAVVEAKKICKAVAKVRKLTARFPNTGHLKRLKDIVLSWGRPVDECEGDDQEASELEWPCLEEGLLPKLVQSTSCTL